MSSPERAQLSVVDEADVIEAGIATANPEQLATMAGWLARMTALVQLRIIGASPPAEEPDHWLNTWEAAKMMGMSASWLYEHKGEFAFCRKVGGRYRFSEKGLEQWKRRGK
jgi:predicted DNA-binding transcriptional regulator AlpA